MPMRKDIQAAFGGAPVIAVFDATDPFYEQVRARYDRDPQTLRQLLATLARRNGKVISPGGTEHEIDLSPYDEHDPDGTYVILSWGPVRIPELAGKPAAARYAWYRENVLNQLPDDGQR